MTFEGKVLIFKSVILPLVLLVCSVFNPPQRFLAKLERAVFYFLWGSKWERLKREIVKKGPENGGKGLPDPHLFLGSRFTALHINYVTTPSKENKMAAMARFWMGSYLRTLKILPVDLKTPVSFSHPALQNRHKDLSWMVAHEILPVRAAMHSRGMAKNPVCPRSGCNSPETVHHLLWECGAARDLWAKTGPLFFPCLPAGGA